MIYDCFTFFNELELLELRLHELAGVADRFVLVEARRTFTNRPKELVFQNHRERFREFLDRIIHVVVEDSPDIADAWAVERFQRNCIGRGLTGARQDDWILISDLDEIPRAATVRRLAEGPAPFRGFWADAAGRPLLRLLSRWKFSQGRARRNNPCVYKFKQSNHRQFLNCVTVAPPAHAEWFGTRMLLLRDFSTAQEIRHSGYKVVPDGGWHFTSMGGVARIQEKIRSFAHQEYNRPEFMAEDRLAAALADGKSVFHPGEVFQYTALDETYPRHVREHPEKFAGWIKPG